MRSLRLNIENRLLFLMGLFSTFQIITLAGTNLFSWIVALFVCKEIISNKKIRCNKEVSLFVNMIILSTILCLFLSSYWTSNIAEWKNNSIKSTIIFFVNFFSILLY